VLGLEIAIWLICAAVCATVAGNKGRNRVQWAANRRGHWSDRRSHRRLPQAEAGGRRTINPPRAARVHQRAGDRQARFVTVRTDDMRGPLRRARCLCSARLVVVGVTGTCAIPPKGIVC
jgi:hypothetical protein